MMKLPQNLRNVISDSYFYLLSVFVLVVFLVQLKIIPEFFLNYTLLGIIIGFFGIALYSKEKVQISHYLLFGALILVLVTRIIPYFSEAVPLGYDPGLYKYLFENPFAAEWLKGMYPLLYSIIMFVLNFLLGEIVTIYILPVILSLLICYVLYYVVKKLFSKEAGLIAAVLFAVSITQFQAYWFAYYKNMIGIMLLLISLLLISDKKRFNLSLILIGGIIAGIHRPAFFLFGLTYLISFLIDLKGIKSKQFWSCILNGSSIILLAIIFNFDRIKEYLFSGLIAVGDSVANLSGGSGTFFGIESYVLFTLPFIPFAITGFLKYFKKHRELTIASLIVLIMVIFQLFFHNRFIIYLDIFVIMFASLGFIELMKSKKIFGYILLSVFVLISILLILSHASNSNALISQQEFNEIKSFNEILPENATILVTDKYYSPWLKGYVYRTVYAPGLFEDINMNRDDWLNFWTGVKREEYLNDFNKPLYIHVGERQKQYSFEEDCFKQIFGGKCKLYEFTC